MREADKQLRAIQLELNSMADGEMMADLKVVAFQIGMIRQLLQAKPPNFEEWWRGYRCTQLDFRGSYLKPKDVARDAWMQANHIGSTKPKQEVS